MSSGRKIEPGMAAAVSGTFVGSFPTDAGRDVRRVPQYAAPREVGCFSVVGEHRDFVNGRDELKYLCMPREPDALSWNLNKGLEDAVWANFDEPERLDRLLRWITENRREVTSDRDPQRRSLGVNFVCKRGLLSTLACTPYRKRDDWLFSATRYKNTLYLCKFESESPWESQNPKLAKQMYFWGHKFEQYMTSNRPGALPDTSAPLRSGDQFYVVLKGRLGSHSLLFGNPMVPTLFTAEVDAIDNDVSQEPGSTAAYVEFKTARIMTHPNQERNFFGNKLLSCWSQSFLTGVPRVMVGFRTAYGEVQSVQEYSVEEMPSLARGQWSDRVCLGFLDEMLSFVKECVTEDDPNAVYLFTLDPRQDPKVVCKKLSDPGEFQILSSSYLNALGH
ncbi:decapping and exoribonuclease protein [Ixodes scapularis]|uniref:decapping and exoribonuclease protein n=1 Tax=Ixodes scapularis TaxID=6945 RepID=UPI001C391D66|nr:decapping and exoribonuclease protein [Ixodes scapularis]